MADHESETSLMHYFTLIAIVLAAAFLVTPWLLLAAVFLVIVSAWAAT